jgi:hypothetical protein
MINLPELDCRIGPKLSYILSSIRIDLQPTNLDGQIREEPIFWMKLVSYLCLMPIVLSVDLLTHR